jgi:hypothetical protein
MKYTFFLLVLPVLFGQKLIAQTGISFAESELYDSDRYKDIKGSPYLFSVFTDAWITDRDGVQYGKVKINYNGYTEEFEVLQGDRFIRLQEQPYAAVKLLDPESQDTITFVRGVHADFRGQFIQLMYQSAQITLVKKFLVNISESSVNTVGRTDEFKRFKAQEMYFLAKETNQPLRTLKSNKKSWIQALGHKKELEAYLKDNKLNLSKGQNMVQLLQYWEALD